MSKIIITFKATPEDKARWKKALEKEGRQLSEVARAALDRYAKSVEKASNDGLS